MMEGTVTAANTGFKEWLVVCKALAAGRQSIILRKGGIAEGRSGFSFQHDAFFLFPTLFHQQSELVTENWDEAGVDLDEERARESDESRVVKVDLFVRMEHAMVLRDWATVESLESDHIWKPEVIRERFDYDGDQALSLAFVRVYQLDEPWTFPFHRSFGGCRSWVTLPDSVPDVQDAKPVLSDTDHEVRREKLESAMRAQINPKRR